MQSLIEYEQSTGLVREVYDDPGESHHSEVVIAGMKRRIWVSESPNAFFAVGSYSPCITGN